MRPRFASPRRSRALRAPRSRAPRSAAARLDLPPDVNVVRREERSDVLRVELLRPRREADDVDEEHRDDPALLAMRRRPERRAAVEAEAREVWVLLTATGANRHAPDY